MKQIITLLLGAGLLGSALWLAPAADAATTPVVDAHARLGRTWCDRPEV